MLLRLRIMFRFLLLRLGDALIRAAMGKAVATALPAIFDQVDALLPQVEAEGLGGGAVAGQIATAISNAVSRPAKPAEVEAVVRTYDPRKAATKAARRAAKRAIRELGQ